MKLKGLTLAEILTALAIIGVVSALTIPTLAKSYKNRVFANSLQVSVANFEKAMHQMMSREGVDNLFDTKAWQEIVSNGTYSLNTNSAAADKNAFRDNLSIHLPVSEVESNYGQQNINGLPLAVVGNQPIMFETENGVIYSILIDTTRTSINEARAYENNTSYLSMAANSVNIDLNGGAGPNRLGRDIFYYELSADGRLYPRGGRDQCMHNALRTNSVSTYVNPRNNCVTTGFFCAAYLAENNYNMDY